MFFCHPCDPVQRASNQDDEIIQWPVNEAEVAQVFLPQSTNLVVVVVSVVPLGLDTTFVVVVVADLKIR